MTDLSQLIERVEAATGETQHVVIYDALVLFHRQSWITDNWYDSAMEMRSAGAFLDAVMTLMPEGYDWIIGNVNGHYGGTPYACVGSTEQHYAATPTLALLAAILRARQAADTESQS